MPKRKLKPKDWEPHIERFQKEINDPWNLTNQAIRHYREMKKKKDDEKQALLDADGNYCGHNSKGWFHHQFICGDCGLIFEEKNTNKNDFGYNHKNHTMRQEPEGSNLSPIGKSTAGSK